MIKIVQSAALKTHLYTKKAVLFVNHVEQVSVADKNDKWHDNVDGFAIIAGKKVSFYVDRECILCSVCSDAAPANFKVSDDDDHDVCYKQPENEEELDQCYEALENCPVEAIGDDGHD